MTEVSDRHRGDLEGQLGVWDKRRPLRVQLILDRGAARLAVQHTAWMLVNLLARMEGVVSEVFLACPRVPLAKRVVPEADASRLDQALLDGAVAIGVVPVKTGRERGADVTFEIGPGPRPETGYRVHGDGWAGALAAAEIPAGRGSDLPFGPYVAACLAAGRVFLMSRAPDIAVEEDYATPVVWSAWLLAVGGVELFGDGPEAIDCVLEAGMAGVGAVGSAAQHTFWAASGVGGGLLAADSDEKGVDITNLNRGVTFVMDSVGQMKAPEAARRLGDAKIEIDPRQGLYQNQKPSPGLHLSAVDTNRAREALQQQYPARIIGASTYGLRAELLRCGPPGRGPCLRCHNPPEPEIDDEELRRRLREATPEQVEKIAANAEVSVEEARRWAAIDRAPECGTVDQAMLATMAAEAGEEPAQFAVAFVSAFAGVLLAAEAVKETMGAEVALSDRHNRASFQFFLPRSPSSKVGLVARDTRCPACRPGPGLSTWQTRREEWGPVRTGAQPTRRTSSSLDEAFPPMKVADAGTTDSA